MKKSIIFSFIILITAILIGCRDDTPQLILDVDKINNELLDSDQLKEEAFYLNRYAYSLMYDNQIANLAVELALDDSLKILAKRIIDDNEIQLEKVRAIANEDDITIPETIDSAALKKIETLRDVRLNIFDHEYLEWAVNHINDSLIELNAVTEKSDSSSPILHIAQGITANMYAHKRSIDKFHEKVGVHYD